MVLTFERTPPARLLKNELFRRVADDTAGFSKSVGAFPQLKALGTLSI